MHFVLELAMAALAQGAGGTPEPLAPLTSLVSTDDYPAAALRNEEQGRVGFRLDVGVDGRVAGCTILTSSLSSALDSTTCRLMVSRARFRSAADASGRPIAGRFEGSITWQLQSSGETPTRLEAIVRLYANCAIGEAAKLSIGATAAAAVPDRAYLGCRTIEPMLLAEFGRMRAPVMVPATALASLKLQLRSAIVAHVEESRRSLPPL